MFGGGFDLSAWQAADAAVEQQQNAATAAAAASGFNASAALAESSSAARASLARLGDWECDECRNVNFAKRTRCNKCGARKRTQTGTDGSNTSGSNGDEPRPHSQKEARRPLFKAGDWHCTHCGNVNWARRTKCNVCNCPKPNQDDEPRTGRGGGHFDLQNPEDRLSHDSEDEEYDEFGRKKKRRRRTPTSSMTVTTTSKASTKPLGNPSTAAAAATEDIDTTTYVGMQPTMYTTVTATTAAAPINTINTNTLYFPSPPTCFLRGRTRSMASISSASSDYEEIYDDDDDS